MIIRRIVFVWFAMATLGSLITYFAYSDDNNKWFVVVQTIALSITVLPLLFLMTVIYYRFFKAPDSLDEFAPSEDRPKAGG